MNDLISRQAAIDGLKRISFSHWFECGEYLSEDTREIEIISSKKALEVIEALPSAQPEHPPYMAEIEAEYQKAVKMPHIHKPLAKALYEVWKKHDREDVERRTDE